MDVIIPVAILLKFTENYNIGSIFLYKKGKEEKKHPMNERGVHGVNSTLAYLRCGKRCFLRAFSIPS